MVNVSYKYGDLYTYIGTLSLTIPISHCQTLSLFLFFQNGDIYNDYVHLIEYSLMFNKITVFCTERVLLNKHGALNSQIHAMDDCWIILIPMTLNPYYSDIIVYQSICRVYKIHL